MNVCFYLCCNYTVFASSSYESDLINWKYIDQMNQKLITYIILIKHTSQDGQEQNTITTCLKTQDEKPNNTKKTINILIKKTKNIKHINGQARNMNYKTIT